MLLNADFLKLFLLITIFSGVINLASVNSEGECPNDLTGRSFNTINKLK